MFTTLWTPATRKTADGLAALALCAGLTLFNGCSGASQSATAAPNITPASGTYTVGQTVTITDTTPGATIYYTTDGSTPTTSSTAYTGPIPLIGVHAVTVLAIATSQGSAASPLAVAAFTTDVPPPIFSPAAGNYSTVQTVTLTDAAAGVTMYYTTDGSTPSSASKLYTGPITVGASETINAYATLAGYPDSAVATAAYSIVFPTAATPVLSPAAGTYNTVQTVTITEATAGATVYYTTDGSTPTSASTRYTAPIAVTKTETINAIAIGTGLTNSVVASSLYTLNLPVVATPVLSPAGGTYNTAQTVAITDATAGATVYYTTDSSTPTSASTVYTGPISVAKSQTINAIAEASGYNNSEIASSTYTLILQLAGKVTGGGQPVKSAMVTLYTVGVSGYGSAGISLGSAMTDSSGNFSVPYFCTPGASEVYLVATGGQSTSTGIVNSGLAMMTALGACSALPDPATATINEATTIASVWALQQFASATFGTAGNFNVGAPGLNATGIANAFAAVNNLVNTGTGAVPLSTPLTATINGTSTTVTVLNEQSRIDTLANILASCAGSNDNPVGTPSAACASLFASVKPSAQAAAPADTLQAALDLATNPTNVGSTSTAPYSLAATAPVFTPALSAAPADFTLALAYGSTTTLGSTGAQSYFLYTPLTLGIDSNGNVYSLNGPASATTSPYNSIGVVAPSGLPVASYYGGTLLNQPRGMALDANNNVWVANQATTTPANGLIRFAQSGGTTNFASTNSLYGIAIDGNNDVFVGSGTAQQVLELIGGTGTLHGLGTVTGPENIAIDASSNVWSVGFSVTNAYKLTATCTGTTCTYGAPILYSGVASPFGIAIDQNSKPWLSQSAANTLIQLNPATPANGGTTTAAKLGGLGGPQYIAIDGAGNVWAANNSPASVTELASTSVARSPGAGFAHTYNAPRGIAIDMSGNVWVGNNGATNATGSYALTEIVGAAAPAVQPLAHAVQLGKIAQLP